MNTLDTPAVGSKRYEQQRVASELIEELRPRVERSRSQMPAVIALMPAVENVLGKHDRIVARDLGYPPNVEPYLRDLRSLGTDPVSDIKSAIQEWENISSAELADSRGIWATLDYVVERKRVNIIDGLKKIDGRASAIKHNIAALQEAIDRFEDRLPAESVVVMVPGKRPTEKPTKVDVGHKIFS